MLAIEVRQSVGQSHNPVKPSARARRRISVELTRSTTPIATQAYDVSGTRLYSAHRLASAGRPGWEPCSSPETKAQVAGEICATGAALAGSTRSDLGPGFAMTLRAQGRWVSRRAGPGTAAMVAHAT